MFDKWKIAAKLKMVGVDIINANRSRVYYLIIVSKRCDWLGIICGKPISVDLLVG